MLRFSGSSQNPGSSVLDELQLSNGLLGKAGEETITIIHPAGDEGMNKFLQVLTGNKTSNSCNVFEMIVCWFSYCFDMTIKTKVCLQNHPKILTWFLVVWPLESRYTFTLRTSSLFPNAMTSVFYKVFNRLSDIIDLLRKEGSKLIAFTVGEHFTGNLTCLSVSQQ